MKRPTLQDLEHRAQKPDHRRIGNWMARRVARPLALRVTWIILPWGISAHGATLTALLIGIVSAAAFGHGTRGGWLLGALLLELWYVLDHVDGQLARVKETASLDGVQFDYLMHHVVHLTVPAGIGLGLFARAAETWWLVIGFVWGVSLLLISLRHDATYKAFVQRLKRVEGRLEVVGGGGGRPEPAPPRPRRPAALCWWLARKTCELHVLMNLLAAVAVGMWLIDDQRLILARVVTIGFAAMALLVAVATLSRSIRSHAAEHEFAAWYRPPRGHDLIFDGRYWHVLPAESAQAGVAGRSESNREGDRLDPIADDRLSFAARQSSSSP